MQHLARARGATIMLVTHDNRILDIADRIIHMEDGRLQSYANAVFDSTEKLLESLANTNRAGELKTIEDLCGKKVGASRSTNWPTQMEELSKATCVAKGRKPMEVIGTEGSVDARTQLKSGRLDAAVQGSETLPYFQKQEPNTLVLIGTPFSEQLTGIPVLKTEPGLRDAIKAAMERLQQKGIYDQILAKYGLGSSKLSPVGINQGK